MRQHDLRIPTWGCFIVAAIALLKDAVSQQRTQISWSIIVVAFSVLASGILNFLASRRKRDGVLGGQGVRENNDAVNASQKALAIPTVGLTLRSTWIDPFDSTTGRNYPRKLNIIFSNDGDEVHLGIAQWIKDQVAIQAGKPSRVGYYLKNHLGQWVDESTTKIAPSGRWLKLWVGLDSSVSDSELNRLWGDGKLGTLEIPAEISGSAIKIRIRPWQSSS